MLNDIFTDEMQTQIKRWGIGAAPLLGLVVGAVVIWILIGQLRGDMALLRTSATDNRTMTVNDRLAQIKAEGEATAAALALLAEATDTPTPTTEAVVQAEAENLPTVTPIADASPEMVALFNKGACTGCHIIPGVAGAVGAVGSDLTGIGSTAEDRQEGVSAEAYIYESLVDPQAFIAPECPNGSCPSGVMLPTFTQALTEAELGQVVDYLVALR